MKFKVVFDNLRVYAASHPVRGAWIEIYISLLLGNIYVVAPREGCVD